MTKQPRFHGLEMIPVYLEISSGQLQEALKQLENLEVCKNKTYILDDDIVSCIIKLHTQQNEMLWIALKQCELWRNQNPTSEQSENIARIERFTQRLKKTNEKILFLANHYKDHTINRLLDKEEGELAIDYLLGNTYSPFDHDQEEDATDDKEPLGPGSVHDFMLFNNPNEEAVKALYEIKTTYPKYSPFLARYYQEYVKEREKLNNFHDHIYEEGMKDIVAIAKELGNFDPLEETPVIQNDAEINVFYDYLSLYRTKNGKRFVCDWLEQNTTVLTSLNEKVVKGYCEARFAVLRIDKNLSHGAIQVVDVISQKPYLLFDKAMNASQKEGCFFCASIINMGDYIMTTGGGILIDGHSSGGKAILTIIIENLNNLRSALAFTPEIALSVRKVYGFCLRNGALLGMTTNQTYTILFQGGVK